MAISVTAMSSNENSCDDLTFLEAQCCCQFGELKDGDQNYYRQFAELSRKNQNLLKAVRRSEV